MGDEHKNMKIQFGNNDHINALFNLVKCVARSAVQFDRYQVVIK